jgi:hypothetical protein
MPPKHVVWAGVALLLLLVLLLGAGVNIGTLNLSF